MDFQDGVPVAGGDQVPTLTYEHTDSLPVGTVKAGLSPLDQYYAQNVILEFDFYLPPSFLPLEGPVYFSIDWVAKTPSEEADPHERNKFYDYTGDKDKRKAWGMTVDFAELTSQAVALTLTNLVPSSQVRRYAAAGAFAVNKLTSENSKIRITLVHGLQFDWTKEWWFFDSIALTMTSVKRRFEEAVSLSGTELSGSWEALSDCPG